MKRVVFVISILGLIVVVWGRSINSYQENRMVETKEIQSKCSSIVGGLRFCTTSPFISVKSGEKAIIRVSLQNMTKVTLPIKNGNFNSLYKITVIDQDGNKIPSFTELLEKKQKEGTITPKELGELLPISSSPAALKSIAPQQELKTEYNLNQFYDFSKKGKYQVEIRRKILKQNGIGDAELSFGAIEVNVK